MSKLRYQLPDLLSISRLFQQARLLHKVFKIHLLGCFFHNLKILEEDSSKRLEQPLVCAMLRLGERGFLVQESVAFFTPQSNMNERRKQ
jgi:hypothetical protein